MRILLFSYHWPPAGGVTVLRSLRLARQLREEGDEPVVVCAAPSPHTPQDPSLLPQAEGIEMHPITAPSPYGAYRRWMGPRAPVNVEEAIAQGPHHWRQRFALWVRAECFFPDAKSPWIGPALRRAFDLHRARPFDAVFSSGPPHSNTEAARRFTERTGVPWWSDFQDPWSRLGYHTRLPLSPWRRRQHLRGEARALATASLRTSASPTWSRELTSADQPVHWWPWGFDDGETPPALAPAGTEIHWVHLGNLGHDRPLEGLWDGWPHPQPLHLHLVGHGPSPTLPPWVQVHRHGFLPRPEALSLAARTHAGLVVVNRLPHQRGRIPAKLYEYWGLGLPVVALCPADSDVHRLVAHTGWGLSVDPLTGVPSRTWTYLSQPEAQPKGARRDRLEGSRLVQRPLRQLRRAAFSPKKQVLEFLSE